MKYYSHNKCKDVEVDLSTTQWTDLRDLYVERLVDNMSTKDLVAYVMDDLDRYYENMSDAEFVDEAQNYWDDHYDDVVEEIKEFTDCKFKKDRKNDPTYLDYMDSERNLD